MSVSVMFNLGVRPSSARTLGALEKKFASFLASHGLARELRIQRVRSDDVTALAASSKWALAISGEHEWTPKAKAEFESAMRSVDPACAVWFETRYPDDDPPLIESLEEELDGDARRANVFFSFDGEDDDVPGDAPMVIPAANLTRLVWRLFLDGDFFGVIDADGAALQVMQLGDGRIWMEIPDPARGGSHGRHIERAELVSLLRALPASISTATVPGLTFARS